ncbi:oxidoreductase [Streptomyces atratus]|uniref:oxidoreductase n=1 Tax=Streptomyces atratus TaxID=1893 RepID=UPI002AC3535B|nr:oxidoreductase [Streptomyces atratus]WPW27112.1 oxidoreductase [Streptomyces atratus]
MDLHLTDKVAVVTGAGKGIGLAVTQALANEGARVVAASRNPTEPLSELAERKNVHFVQVDLTEPDGSAEPVAEAVARFGGLDILVNNVGAVRPRAGGFLSVGDDDWMWAMTVNLLTAVRATRAALPHLIKGGSGSVVTVSSVSAFLPDPSVIDYCASKAALTNFCKALSKEVGPHGVRVNTVSPGPVATDLWLGEGGIAATVAATDGTAPDTVAQEFAARAVSGRFTRPEEVADLVLLLASGRSGNVTGSDFVIDGGLITTL